MANNGERGYTGVAGDAVGDKKSLLVWLSNVWQNKPTLMVTGDDRVSEVGDQDPSAPESQMFISHKPYRGCFGDY